MKAKYCCARVELTNQGVGALTISAVAVIVVIAGPAALLPWSPTTYLYLTCLAASTASAC